MYPSNFTLKRCSPTMKTYHNNPVDNKLGYLSNRSCCSISPANSSHGKNINQNLAQVLKHLRYPSVPSLSSLLVAVLLLLSNMRCSRASEFPDRECCDSAPPPPPFYHTTTSTTPVPPLTRRTQFHRLGTTLAPVPAVGGGRDYYGGYGSPGTIVGINNPGTPGDVVFAGPPSQNRGFKVPSASEQPAGGEFLY